MGLSDEERQQYPVVTIGDDLFLCTEDFPVATMGVSPTALASRIDGFLGQERIDAVPSGQNISLPLNIVQVNASTLKDGAKLDLYLQQFDDLSIHIGGLEETRRRSTAVATRKNFILVTTAATSEGEGGYGCYLVGVAILCHPWLHSSKRCQFTCRYISVAHSLY